MNLRVEILLNFSMLAVNLLIKVLWKSRLSVISDGNLNYTSPILSANDEKFPTYFSCR